MADFKHSYDKTAINEGGYANDPDDNGGETWKGIARKMHPRWPGWQIIDIIKLGPNFKKKLADNGPLQALVLEFYKKEFWDRVKGDQLDNQEVADSLYDSSVNMGVKAAIILIQRSLGLTESGIMSNFLINKINNKQ